jgi:hypothetical protein
VREAARSLLFAALAGCLLLWVALYNGYPAVYPDTASYIYTGAFHIPLPPFRSPGYSVFIARTSFAATPWFTIVAQAIAVAAVLYEVCKYLIGGDAKFRDHCLLTITAALAALTSLPWFTSLLMPDVFAGVAFLALYLLGFEARLHLAERIVLAAIATLGVGAHISLLPIAILFVAVLAVVKLAGWLPGWTPSAKTMLPWLVAPLVIAGLWTAELNRSMALGFRLSPSGDEYLMGRLLEDGLAGDFLRANCPQKHFAACRYLNDLPKTPEQFLFWHPLLSEMELNGDEIHEVVRGTLAAYPLQFAWNSTRHSLRQFVQLRTGDEVRGLALGAPNATGTIIRRVFPRDTSAYEGSKLIQGRLVSMTKVVAIVDSAAFWLSALACIILAVRQRHNEKWNWFFYSTIAYLFFNAAVCATLAGVYDRYQSRVAWLIPLCLASFVSNRRRVRNGSARASDNRSRPLTIHGSYR